MTTTIHNFSYYAKIFKLGKTFMIVDSANQCLFATTSEKQAKNRLTKILKGANLIYTLN